MRTIIYATKDKRNIEVCAFANVNNIGYKSAVACVLASMNQYTSDDGKQITHTNTRTLKEWILNIDSDIALYSGETRHTHTHTLVLHPRALVRIEESIGGARNTTNSLVGHDAHTDSDGCVRRMCDPRNHIKVLSFIARLTHNRIV